MALTQYTVSVDFQVEASSPELAKSLVTQVLRDRVAVANDIIDFQAIYAQPTPGA